LNLKAGLNFLNQSNKLKKIPYTQGISCRQGKFPVDQFSVLLVYFFPGGKMEFNK